MPDVFVSYSSQDRSRVAPLVQAIERRGWTVWWDRKIDAGTAYDREIESAIDEAKCIVVVWSTHSIDSDWVRNEATEGLERATLVPVTIDAVRPPLAFRRTQTIDLATPGTSVEALIEAIRRFCPVGDRVGVDASPFIGRQVELARLEELTQSATAGKGAFVLLSGEAGVGKTRLVKETEAIARRADMLVLVGRCQDTEGAPPYQPLLEQIEQAMRLVPPGNFKAALGENAPELAKLLPELRQQFPGIPEPIELPPDQERRYLLHGCTEFIARAAQAQPLMLVFEDLHWAGESTCRLLRYLAERLRDARVLLVGTYRDTDLDPRAPFSETLHQLLRERLVEDIPLRSLGADQVAALIEGRAGACPPAELIALIVSETEGNPFFVEELYRHLEETQKLFDAQGRFKAGISIADTEVPRGVRLIIEHRIAKVSDGCRKVLTASAVTGRVVGYELLLRICDLDDDALIDALEEADAASLIEDVSVGREVRYQFVHEQIRQTLVGTLSLPRRQRLHLRIADALEGGSAAEIVRSAGQIAVHLYQAGAAADSERAVQSLLAASQRAVGSVAFEDAMKLLDMAEEVVPEDDRASRARILGLRALALRGGARTDEALTVFAAGLALGNDHEMFPELLRQRARLLLDLYRGDEALPDVRRLLDLAQTARDRSAELTAQSMLSEAHYKLSLDRPEHASLYRDSAERTIELAREAGDRRALALALIVTGHFVDYWTDQRAQAVANLAEARAITDALGEESLSLDCATMALRVMQLTNVEFEVRAEEILKRLEALGDPLRLKEHLFWMIGPTRTAGHLTRSVEVCDRAIELAARLNVPPVQYPTFKALALVPLGRFDAAWQSIGQEVAHGEYRFGAALQRLGYFFVQSELGAVDAVFAEAGALLEECRALNRIWMVEMIVDLLATCGGRAGRHADTVTLLDHVAPDVPPRSLAAAELALAAGDVDGALAAAQRIEQTRREQGEDLIAANAAELVARCLARREQWQPARDAVDRTIAFCEQSDARHLLWRALALRGRANARLGEGAAARRNYAEAAQLLQTLAAAAPDDSLRAAFLSQPAARDIQLAIEETT